MKKQILLLLLMTSVVTMHASWFGRPTVQQRNEDCKQVIAAYAQAIAEYNESGSQRWIGVDLRHYENLDFCQKEAEKKFPKNSHYKVSLMMGKVQPDNSQNIIIVVEPINN